MKFFRRHWADLDQSEKLGYLWLLSFVILVVSVAATIIIPIYLNPEEDDWEEYDDEESMRRPPVEHRLAEGHQYKLDGEIARMFNLPEDLS